MEPGYHLVDISVTDWDMMKAGLDLLQGWRDSWSKAVFNEGWRWRYWSSLANCSLADERQTQLFSRNKNQPADSGDKISIQHCHHNGIMA